MFENPFEDAEEIELPPLDTGDSAESELAYLRQRKEELLRRKEDAERTIGEALTGENWPSFFPLLRYAPEQDLPPSAHSSAKRSLIAFLAACGSSLLNFIAVLCVSGLKDYPKAKNIVYSLLQGAGGVYLVYTFTYKKLYIACVAHDIPVSWSFINFALMAWFIYLFVGLPASGSVGLATTLDLAAAKKWFAFTMGILNTAGIGVVIFFVFVTLAAAQQYQKVSGIEQATIVPNDL